MYKRFAAALCTAAAIVSLVAAPANAGGLLNGNFDTPTPGLSGSNYAASVTAFGAHTPSSAEYWVLDNTLGRANTSSELLTSTDPNGGGYMLHFSTTAYTGELRQRFDLGSVLQKATASIDILVLSGKAQISFDNDVVTVNASPNWQKINLGLNRVLGGDSFTIGAYATGVNCYLDNASVTIAGTVPEPSSLCLALIGLFSLYGASHFKRS